MDSQQLQAWNLAHPIGTPVLAKHPAQANLLPTKTRSTAYSLDGTPVALVSGISTPIPLSAITTEVKTGPKFPVALTTWVLDEAHLEAIRAAVAAINAENVDLHIEQEEADGDTWWVTISASSANRVYHLGGRMGKWLAEQQKGDQES